MDDFQLKAPVRFLIFNRPDLTARIFQAILQAKTSKPLEAADPQLKGCIFLSAIAHSQHHSLYRYSISSDKAAISKKLTCLLYFF